MVESDFASLNRCNRIWNFLICLMVALLLPAGLTLLAMDAENEDTDKIGDLLLYFSVLGLLEIVIKKVYM